MTETTFKSAEQYVLTYSMLGYAENGSKRALVRQLVEDAETEPVSWRLYRLPEDAALESARAQAEEKGVQACGAWAAEAGTLALEGDCPKAPRTFHCDNYVCDLTEAREKGVYVLQVTFRDGSVLYSSPFPVLTNPYQDQVLLPLSIYNAQARYAANEPNKGYYDCTNPFGEAYSHGTFLYGLSNYYRTQEALLTEEEKEQLYWAACAAYDYLMILWSPTGEVLYAAPERPGDPEHNKGIHNSMEAVEGMAAFLDVFAARDPQRVNAEALERVLKTVDYIDSELKAAKNEYYGETWKLTVFCRLYGAYGHEELLDKARSVANAALAHVDYAGGSRDQVCSAVEGLWLLCRLDPSFKESERFVRKAEQWRKTAAQIVENSAYQFPSFHGRPNQMAENYLGHYYSNWDIFWVLNQSVLNIARDACFLWDMTGDDHFEKIAAGALQFVSGCNFGIAKSVVTVDGSAGGPMACASFIGNSWGCIKMWWEGRWGFAMQNHSWASIVNGYTTKSAEQASRHNGYVTDSADYVYTDHDWQHGETFIRMDGVMIYAASLYERMVNQQ